MSNALATQDHNEILTVMQNSLYPGANMASIELALGYCKAAQLDPMMKPVHIVPMWDRESGRMRDVIMPGIGLYRTMAARSGQYAGMSEPEFGPDVTEKIGGAETTYPQWCKITVRRLLSNGSIAEFTAIERWKENYAIKGGKERSVAPNAMWAKRPYAQLAKCTQAQSLRMAFPELVPAQPTADEMEGKEYGNIIESEKPKITPTAGAGDNLTPERKIQLNELADKVREFLAGDSVADAVLEIDNAELDADEKTFLWTMFDSKERSAMKKEVKRQRDEATEKAKAKAIENHNAAEQALISDAQKRRLEARISELGLDRENVKFDCHEKYGVDHFQELTVSQYKEIDKKFDDMEVASQI